MLGRIKVSLFQPSKIANYQRDSKATTIFYFVFLALLATIPSIILIFSSVGLDYAEKTEIRNVLRGQEIPFEIVDYKLVKKIENDDEYFKIELSDTIDLIFTELDSSEIKYNPFNLKTSIFFTSDEAIYFSSIFDEMHISYSTYPKLKELDFGLVKTNDSSFWDNVFPIVNEKIKENAPRYKALNFVTFFLFSLISLILFSLFVAFFQRTRLSGLIGFGKIWQLTIYAMTPYIFLTLFGDLYGLEILSLVGIIVSYIYASKMSLSLIKK